VPRGPQSKPCYPITHAQQESLFIDVVVIHKNIEVLESCSSNQVKRGPEHIIQLWEQKMEEKS